VILILPNATRRLFVLRTPLGPRGPRGVSVNRLFDRPRMSWTTIWSVAALFLTSSLPEVADQATIRARVLQRHCSYL